MINRALFVLVVAMISFTAVGADETKQIALSDSDLAALVARNFGGARPAGVGSLDLPKFLISDLNGDGTDDLVVAYTDEESRRRGEGCYGIGIVNGVKTQHPSKAFEAYDCFNRYELKELQGVPFSFRGEITIRTDLKTSGPCVRLTLKYGNLNIVCWTEGAYRSDSGRP